MSLTDLLTSLIEMSLIFIQQRDSYLNLWPVCADKHRKAVFGPLVAGALPWKGSLVA